MGELLAEAPGQGVSRLVEGKSSEKSMGVNGYQPPSIATGICELQSLEGRQAAWLCSLVRREDPFFSRRFGKPSVPGRCPHPLSHISYLCQQGAHGDDTLI